MAISTPTVGSAISATSSVSRTAGIARAGPVGSSGSGGLSAMIEALVGSAGIQARTPTDQQDFAESRDRHPDTGRGSIPTDARRATVGGVDSSYAVTPFVVDMVVKSVEASGRGTVASSAAKALEAATHVYDAAIQTIAGLSRFDALGHRLDRAF